ncbi:MAG: tetratricopeptide repeat protein, partial [Candidatus Obscuribacterales bacterium]
MTPAETAALAIIAVSALAAVVLLLVLVRARLEAERKLNAALREELLSELKTLARSSRDEIDQVKSSVDSTLKRLELRAMGSGAKEGAPEIDDNLKPFLAELDTILTSIASQIIDDTRDGTRTIKESMQDLQAKLVEMSAVDKFVQLLEDRDERQRALISAIRRLGDDEVAARLAVAYPSEGATSILQDIAVSGKGNELVGWALMGVADRHLQNGTLDLAETFYKQALFSLENSLGENHEDVAEILDSLAKIAMGQGRPVEAEEMLERAGKIKASLLGAEHTEVAESSIRLADLYSKQERYQEALPLYQRAFEISKKSLGPEHPQCLSLLHRLAEINETHDE